MKRFAIWGINLYQKYISPYKGYRCAYGVYHQNGTCSSIIKGHIQREGLIKAYPLIREQFANCKDAYELLMIQREEQKKRKKQKEERLKGEKKKKVVVLEIVVEGALLLGIVQEQTVWVAAIWEVVVILQGCAIVLVE